MSDEVKIMSKEDLGEMPEEFRQQAAATKALYDDLRVVIAEATAEGARQNVALNALLHCFVGFILTLDEPRDSAAFVASVLTQAVDVNLAAQAKAAGGGN